MKKYTFSQLSTSEKEKLTIRGAVDFSKIFPIVKDIEKKVISKGDEALQELSKKFDKVSLENFAITEENYQNSENLVDNDFKKAITIATNNIRKFHTSQTCDKKIIETTTGVKCWRESRAIEKVGLYIPGGTAPLFYNTNDRYSCSNRRL